LSRRLSINIIELLYIIFVSIYSGKKFKILITFSDCHFNTSNGTTIDFQGEVTTQVNYLVAIGCASIVLGYLQVAFWGMSAERQTRAIRKNLFRSILRKEIVFFDTHKTGELNTKLTDDIDKIHNGIGDKVGSAVQFVSACVTGLILGKFIYESKHIISNFFII
jgi:ABC-type multidrug transport system fused ATPase/permease subunit